jgi:hypothetical protein
MMTRSASSGCGNSQPTQAVVTVMAAPPPLLPPQKQGRREVDGR